MPLPNILLYPINYRMQAKLISVTKKLLLLYLIKQLNDTMRILQKH